MDTFSYKFRESVPETGLEKEISFQVKEKRIVSCNPSLGNQKKAKAFITKGFRFIESARRDSNPRPRPWQGRTPPTEPLAHIIR